MGFRSLETRWISGLITLMERPFLPLRMAASSTAEDGLPDNIPGHNQAFHPAVPITLDTVSGNTITIDLGGGQFCLLLSSTARKPALQSKATASSETKCSRASAAPATPASRICISKSPIHRK